MESAQRASDSRGLEAPATAANDPGLLEIAQALWGDLRRLAFDHLQLAALETERAGRTLVSMVFYGVAAAILLVAAWLGLMAAVALGLVTYGLNAALAVLLVAALNVAAAYVLFLLIRRSSHYLRFPATMRSLKSDATMLARPDQAS